MTQYNLAFVISRLGQYMGDLCLGHGRATKRVLQYLKRTITFGLKYSADVKQYKAFYGRPSLVGYTNTNYAGDIKGRQSIMG